MLNTHEALLRNRDSLSGQVALLGLSDAAVLASLPCDGGLVQTDHFGIYGRSWRCGLHLHSILRKPVAR